VLTTNPANAQLQIQGGQVQSRGIELESTASLAANLNIVGSFTHDQVLYTRDFSGLQDKRPVYTPMNMASLWMDYTPSRFGVVAGARFIGITEADPANTINVPGHTVLDFESHYIVHDVRVAVSSANLLNKTYVSYCFDTIACNWGAVRTVTGTLTYRFNSILHPFEEK
jgi:iron complex outermembrane receptor protein